MQTQNEKLSTLPQQQHVVHAAGSRFQQRARMKKLQTLQLE